MNSSTPKTKEVYDRRCPFVKPFIGTDPDNSNVHLLCLRCKRWSCDYCARRNKKAVIMKIARASPNKLITLTINPSLHESPESCYKAIRPKVRKLFEQIRSEYGLFECAMVCEITKKGWPHWHIAARTQKFIPQKWLSQTWDRMTGARIVDIRKVNHPEKAAGYIAKYMMKGITSRPFWLKRVVSYTRKFHPPKEAPIPKPFAYERSTLSVLELLASYIALGWTILRGPGGFICLYPGNTWPESYSDWCPEPELVDTTQPLFTLLDNPPQSKHDPPVEFILHRAIDRPPHLQTNLDADDCQ